MENIFFISWILGITWRNLEPQMNVVKALTFKY